MKLKKKIILSASGLLVIVLIFGVRFGLQYANIASAYASKTVCSGVFVSGRDFMDVKTEDLYKVPYVDVKVDYENKSVTSSIYGLAKTTAIYRPGFGATLLNGANAEELRNQDKLKISDSIKSKQELVHAPVPAEIDSIKLFELIDRVFTEDDTSYVKNTRALVVLYDGKIIAERYGSKINANMPLIGWSMSKSVTNAMIGLMVFDGKLDIFKPAPVDEWKNDERKSITIDQLLRMSSGLEFEEDYGKPCDATNMLFRNQSTGIYAIHCKLATVPGNVFSYSSGTSNILQEIIRRQFKHHADYLAFPYNRLFRKLGMNSVVFEPDASGTFIGSSYMYATALDWAKFGQLYLQDGVWGGERLLPEAWVKYSGTESKNSGGVYAAQFWVNHKDKEFPFDAFYADGFEGQFVTIVPSKKAVIVRLGCTHGKQFDNVKFVKDILKAWK
jgi:CubicO group peptidase (beta-lactamase class C family)